MALPLLSLLAYTCQPIAPTCSSRSTGISCSAHSILNRPLVARDTFLIPFSALHKVMDDVGQVGRDLDGDGWPAVGCGKHRLVLRKPRERPTCRFAGRQVGGLRILP